MLPLPVTAGKRQNGGSETTVMTIKRGAPDIVVCFVLLVYLLSLSVFMSHHRDESLPTKWNAGTFSLLYTHTHMSGSCVCVRVLSEGHLVPLELSKHCLLIFLVELLSENL